MNKKTVETTLKWLKTLPDGRRLFFNTGVLMIEITKEEAIQKLEELLKEIEDTKAKEGKDEK